MSAQEMKKEEAALKYDGGKAAYELLDHAASEELGEWEGRSGAVDRVRGFVVRWTARDPGCAEQLFMAWAEAAALLCPTAPTLAMRHEVARVLEFGARKYAPNNWRKGMSWSRLVGAALRHLAAFERGEICDPETGLPHLGHLGCCLMFLIVYQREGLGTDDRCSK
jgi:hypothetical protein